MLHRKFENREQEIFVRKQSYLPPRVVCYGAVRDLTKGGSGGLSEYNSNNEKCSNDQREKSCTATSDRGTKENIIYIGSHPLGIGLYLFDYKPEFRDAWGHGRQFGVMADEVEKVMPEAVSVHPDGYKMVDYAMLGISRNLH